jgi:hypothetical protein
VVVEIVHQGRLKGPFIGFRDTRTVFKFADGTRWTQKVYKYYYHSAHRPSATIVCENAMLYIQIEGMTESVEVTKG